MEQNPWGKGQLEKPETKWEDMIKKDMESLGGGSNWNGKLDVKWSWEA